EPGASRPASRAAAANHADLVDAQIRNAAQVPFDLGSSLPFPVVLFVLDLGARLVLHPRIRAGVGGLALDLDELADVPGEVVGLAADQDVRTRQFVGPPFGALDARQHELASAGRTRETTRHADVASVLDANLRLLSNRGLL